ncbi:hypothetical protein [Luteimonas terrae]|uniref:DNA-binding transcriptional repressor CapW winged helix-turn-helix domain-containing protein n=1 Tax=Luteimonas terrae TaxID=1530191 RepID=A0ABU1XX87_9GAMM|nr:hypothetical protein [Luteimonas terrae]MDR7193377.1 hypothetical protein [Luteimonas terrae]
MGARRSYAVEQRLRLIDFLLQQYGHFNRAALVDYFGISVPQASADLSAYLELAPGNAEYDVRRKTYVRTDRFARVYP